MSGDGISVLRWDLMIEDKQRQWRATFEDTKKAQETLRKKIHELRLKNRCIKDEEERTLMLGTYIPNATLGIGILKSHEFQLPDGNVASFDNIEYWMRKLCLVTKNILPKGFIHSNQESEIPISFAWEKLEEELFLVYPMALNKSISMSKEREKRERSEGADIDSF